MNHSIEAVTFDAAGTLFEIAEPVGITYSRVARIHGLSVDPKALELTFRELWNRYPAPHSTPRINNGEADGHDVERTWWKHFVQDVFETASGGEVDNLDPIFSDLFDHYAKPASWRILPGVVDVLTSILGQVKLAVISNFDRRFYSIARGLKIERFFDAIILSGAIEASKPEPAIFAAAARELNVDPASILHIGDDPIRDWQGAAASGFQVYPLNSEANPMNKIPSIIFSRQ